MATHTGDSFPDAIVYDRAAEGELPFDGTNAFWTPDAYDTEPMFLLDGTPSAGTFPSWDTAAHSGDSMPGYADDWFERIHLIPTRIDLGNILSSQIREVEIYNAYRLGVTQDLTAFSNNAGLGVLVTNLPLLPYTIEGQSSIVLNIQVSSVGSPTLSGTLDFTTDDGLRQLTLTGRRVILMPVRPQSPVLETIEFKTDVISSRNEVEQRIALRDGPRQIIELSFYDEEAEAAGLRALIFDWLPRVWGVPSWWEERDLDADAAADSLTVQVDTSYMDLRVGGLAVIYTDQFDFEALEVDSFDATSVTFTSPLQRDHAAETSSFMPVRVCYADQRPSGGQRFSGQDRMRMEFTTIETVDLSDASAFPTYNGLVVLSEGNLVPGRDQHSQSWRRSTDQLDSVTGLFRVFELTDRSRIQMVKGFHLDSAQRLWEVRQLFHFLKGQQTAFYLPTFRSDMQVVQTITAGGTSVTIQNIGFTDFISQREPFAAVMMTLKDGTQAIREVTASVVASIDEENLTIDSQFSASAIEPEDVAHLGFAVLVRNSDDRLVIEHQYPGRGFATMPVISTKA